jgi:hypothetical protein
MISLLCFSFRVSVVRTCFWGGRGALADSWTILNRKDCLVCAILWYILHRQPSHGLCESFKEYLQRHLTWGDVYILCLIDISSLAPNFQPWSPKKRELISSVQSEWEHIEDLPNLWLVWGNQISSTMVMLPPKLAAADYIQTCSCASKRPPNSVSANLHCVIAKELICNKKQTRVTEESGKSNVIYKMYSVCVILWLKRSNIKDPIIMHCC